MGLFAVKPTMAQEFWYASCMLNRVQVHLVQHSVFDNASQYFNFSHVFFYFYYLRTQSPKYPTPWHNSQSIVKLVYSFDYADNPGACIWLPPLRQSGYSLNRESCEITFHRYVQSSLVQDFKVCQFLSKFLASPCTPNPQTQVRKGANNLPRWQCIESCRSQILWATEPCVWSRFHFGIHLLWGRVLWRQWRPIRHCRSSGHPCWHS